ncbi:ATP-binding cassette domain-containing protein [Anaerococcus sp. NML200537]|uniref:ABC transporter ATP-binding protein/permease n=1 Tax=Anaerococcus sp. NML200537 TaxID=2954485 RepID=UPI00223700CE|nr:ATP-binding cassette domain-containing protein [Anaerococcus sp. NML200537]MCW6702358.1 ATP-binding cassette domain-containing protein [Anaerococcus sp. NML200537]
MLKLKNISKIYHTQGFSQKALDGVSISFRENEFVSILGQSGGGKTTLLNIIGGLMRYDEGDLIIDGRSTKKFTDKDWDFYRNVRIGFIFQSYNLISHQTVLDNVILSLTLSNKDTGNMKDKAIKALERVGLKDHIYKKPSELSGGQMQRVAIARALVNDPQILLADEPTGALDSETSLAIMDLLKEIAKDKLVIMVTHNQSLAEEYSTRIIGIKDGQIISDSNPYEDTDTSDNFKISKIALKLRTALGLSFNNLLNKKARTLLTAFAGSIGIIGVALILSISNGASEFIEENQKNALKSYPIEIEKSSVDLASLGQMGEDKNKNTDQSKVASNDIGLKNRSKLSGSGLENDLEKFKLYLEANDQKLSNEVGNNFISYTYDGKFDIFTKDPKGELVNTDGSDFENVRPAGFSFPFAFGASKQNPNISQLITTKDGQISPMVKDEYEIVAGHWPENPNELILFTDYNNQILRSKFYELGFLPKKEYEDILRDLDDKKKVDIKKVSLDSKEILGKEYKILSPSDYYEKEGNNFVSIKENQAKVDEKIKDAKTLKIVGIAKKTKDDDNRIIQTPLAYTEGFTKDMIAYVNNQEIIKKQIENQDTNVLNGLKFRAENDDEKIKQSKDYLNNLTETDLARVNGWILQNKEDLVKKMQEESKKLAMAGKSLASPNESQNNRQMVDYLLKEDDKNTFLEIYDEFLKDFSYKKNLENLGYIEEKNPSKISIYVDNFENRDKVKVFIDEYNQGKDIENQISFTDLIGIISKSITDIIGAISYILIAFVGVSLIVSSIMIGIITYISVFERTKEIGILRAIGASKKDIYKVFMAETMIIGLLSGLIGVGLSYILNIFITRIIVKMSGFAEIGAKLPLEAALILILISVALSLIAGLIPSRIAANKDPVEALSAE